MQLHPAPYDTIPKSLWDILHPNNDPLELTYIEVVIDGKIIASGPVEKPTSLAADLPPAPERKVVYHDEIDLEGWRARIKNFDRASVRKS